MVYSVNGSPRPCERVSFLPHSFHLVVFFIFITSFGSISPVLSISVVSVRSTPLDLSCPYFSPIASLLRAWFPFFVFISNIFISTNSYVTIFAVNFTRFSIFLSFVRCFERAFCPSSFKNVRYKKYFNFVCVKLMTNECLASAYRVCVLPRFHVVHLTGDQRNYCVWDAIAFHRMKTMMMRTTTTANQITY